MKARIAYLTTPAPGVYLLNFQIEHGVDMSIEISKGHLTNILIDGTSLALREQQYVHRVPETITQENANGGDYRR